MTIQVLTDPSLENQDDTVMSVPASLLFKIIPDDKSMVVNDNEGQPIFSVKCRNTAIHCQREVYQIVSGTEHPSLKLQRQIATLHAHCYGYNSSVDKFQTYGKKLLSVSKNGILQNHTDLNVKLLYTFPDFGASLENDKYKIVGSWSKKSLIIHKSGSSTVIAKVCPGDTNDEFMVEVSSNVNCAFVIFLIAAVDCMKDPGTLKHAGKAISFVLKNAAGGAISGVGQVGANLLFS